MGAELAKQLERVEDMTTHTRKDSVNRTMEEQLETYDFLRLTVADINGIPRGKVVPKRHALAAMRDGIGAYGGTNCKLL